MSSPSAPSPRSGLAPGPAAALDAAPSATSGDAREALLELHRVRHTVRNRGADVEILQEVSLTARAGEVTILLGPNGAGKTTTLTLAQGLARPTGGTVRLLGLNPWQAGAGLRSRVGVMLQEGGLPPSSSPAQLLRHVCRLYRHPVDMEALTARLGIDEFAGRDIRRLSGGQRQRVALAAALAGRPRVVFLDEPTAGLDPVSRQLVVELVHELKAAGVAIVLTTHLLDDAQRLADQVVLLRRGRVERSGTVDELTAHTDVAPLVFRLPVPAPAAALERVPHGLEIRAQTPSPPGPAPAGREAQAGRTGQTYLVAGASTPQALATLAGWWKEHDLMPTDLHLARRSLEDVFLEVAP